MRTSLEIWIDTYHPDAILEYDVNKCIFSKDGHIHFVMKELTGIEAIHLIDEEIKRVIKLDYDVLSEMFKEYLKKDMKEKANLNII